MTDTADTPGGSILVALDGTEISERALDVAIPLVRGLGGSLILVSVWEGLVGLDRAVPSEEAERMGDAEQAARQAYLRDVQARYCDPAGISTIHLVPEGDLDVALRNVAAARQGRYLVMVTRAHTGIKRWYLGSDATRVADHSDIPAIIYHPLGSHAAPLSLQRVAVLVDESAGGQEAIEQAAALAHRLHATLTLVVPGEGEPRLREGERWETVLAARYPDLWLRVTGQRGKPLDVLIAAAHDADLIVHALDDERHWYDWLLGSEDEQALIRETGVPVLLVQPPAHD